MGNSSTVCCVGGPKKLMSGSGERRGVRGGSSSPARMRGSVVLGREGGLNLLPDNTGRVPKDKYDIEKSAVGSGAFGTVKKAKVKNGEKIVALKTIKKSAIPNLDAFVNEVEINAALDHPNIAKLLETFEDRQNVYLCLELCNGGEMFDKIIDQGSGFGELDTASLMLQILRAVFYMHSVDIAHRDLKPENFLLTEALPKKVPIRNNTLKVIDFGIAKRFKRNKEGKTIPMTTKAGTAYYVAPDVINGRYDEKCDVWSCGVILYILLSGSPPFGGDNDREIMAAAKKGKIYFDHAFDTVSKEAKELILKMCNIKVSERLSAEQALNTTWVQHPSKIIRVDTRDAKSSAEFLQRMKGFSAVNRFKKAALHVIAHRLDDKIIKNLREQFTRMDLNGDGKLTLNELQTGLQKAGLTDMGDVKKLFEQIDTDKSGEIGYTEFLAAMIEGKNYQDEETVWEAFRIFDRNGDGGISLDELKVMLSENHDIAAKVANAAEDAEVEELFRSADVNGDGQISFEEFMTMMRS
eukprot:TRINITY_DN11568_c0_g2_i1.p1 TRINITY_DN11568_c0_g2~~TRINITY_DN11568_c0_g2_i1.p1  ORF type:complete len:550 (-),score=174.79 TRINITY_DN11568_c0_g2_i1:263-1831(-)